MRKQTLVFQLRDPAVRLFLHPGPQEHARPALVPAAVLHAPLLHQLQHQLPAVRDVRDHVPAVPAAAVAQGAEEHDQVPLQPPAVHIGVAATIPRRGHGNGGSVMKRDIPRSNVERRVRRVADETGRRHANDDDATDNLVNGARPSREVRLIRRRIARGGITFESFVTREDLIDDRRSSGYVTVTWISLRLTRPSAESTRWIKGVEAMLETMVLDLHGFRPSLVGRVMVA